MKLSLDPDIYAAAINTKLGVLSTIAEAAKQVPVTLRQAAKSSSAVILKCRVERGAGDAVESRVVELVCDADAAPAAKVGAGSLLNDTLKLGGTVTSNWTIKSVS
jgi:hypothetical protein